ncbi:NAD(P)-dependent oxidoreductase [Bifidobacterium sp. ESL0784]|uniref:NAD(P)-dependent oxidoreductase n=1 Tax=Bifidobacterium sp. ESL0784 TaxID=2983231 RepID=UPI0023F9B7A4|nr:NAD(P)-dependent oxidoreductase [Bifidobacterium sp. ESL0784]MDF7641026.1 NAD(P)-dependent oxidoreductase [Bifidobacterium sp. ESL0784]
MTEKILVTGIVPREGLDKLFDRFDVTYSADKPFTRDFVLEHGHEYDGMILMAQKGDRELLDACNNLKVISLNGVGYDHVDVAYAKQKGIVVSNSPREVRIPTAEFTMALILAAVKRLHFYDGIVRRGDWIDPSERKYQGRTLNGLTLGVFGMGRIGKTVAKYAQAFGMKVIYNNDCPLGEDFDRENNCEYVSFDDLLKRSDVVTIHAPELPSTHGLFDAEAFARMKNDAYLINAARGPIVQEQALVDALESGQIAGAGLDVFEFEPKVSEKLRSLPNVMLSPHAGTGTIEARIGLAAEATDNLISFFDGKPINVVNK